MNTSLQATNNSIVGRGAVPGPAYGISFVASGSATDNEISNFFDSVGSEACGIFVDGNAGTVTLTDNTFPDPPGNEEDICDNRP